MLDSSSLLQRRYAMLREWHELLAANLQRVHRSRGVEAIHHARIGARRLRIALQAIGDGCQPVLLGTLLFDLRDLGRALAPARDTDVRKKLLAMLLRHTHGEVANKGTRLLAAADAERNAARERLKHMMRKPAWKLRLQRLAAHLGDEGLLALPRNGAVPPERLEFERRLRAVRKRLKGKRLLKQDLHALRIKTKRARYVAEFLECLKIRPDADVLTHLKTLQGILGELHDRLQLDHWLDTVDTNAELRAQLHELVRAEVREWREQLQKIRTPQLKN